MCGLIGQRPQAPTGCCWSIAFILRGLYKSTNRIDVVVAQLVFVATLVKFDYASENKAKSIYYRALPDKQTRCIMFGR